MNIIILIQAIILIISLIIGYILLRNKKVIFYIERIGEYGLDSVSKEPQTIYGNIITKYNKINSKLIKILANRRFKNKKDSSLYILGTRYKNPLVYLADKLLLGLGFSLICFVTSVITGELINIMVFIISFMIGFYSLDIYVFYRKKTRVKMIREDLLKAIIIMNSVFKAGKTTVQALKIASEELPYPSNIEFQKMYRDITYGLPLDVVFERFSKRVDIEEAKYISSSLTILQKTGGNIVKVFTSIERSLFDKKKLREELKNLTVNSNMIIKVLMVVPIFFVGIISLLNSTYFNPLFESSRGLIILGIIIVMFSIYVFVLNKIMKVRI